MSTLKIGSGMAAVIAFTLAGLCASRSADNTSYEGVWIDHSGRAAVELKPCSGGSASRLCGEVVWLQEPNDSAGKPLVDGNNPNKTLKKRPICGMTLISAMTRQSDGSYDNGKIYDPEKGESFDVAIKLKGRDRLEVTGYLGVKIFSETFMWKRAPANQVRCGGPGGRAI